MTPAARLSAAIEILDAVLGGMPAEQALTNWARGHRFAGSGDRNAIRDEVFDALRTRGSRARLGLPAGAAQTGRGLILGGLRAAHVDPATFFTGEGHAPARLNEAEQALAAEAKPSAETLAVLDWPEWLRPQIEHDLGADFAQVSAQMRERAPVFLRVNRARATVEQAIGALAQDGIVATPHALVATALEVQEGARRISASAAYLDGRVELQDLSSQAAVALVPLAPGMRILDYCAGGGGKSLALAAMEPGAKMTAHDIDAGRMRDLPARARRAGARIAVASPGRIQGKFDLVLVDAPCSGTGTWRRTPDAKWRLTPERLEELVGLQSRILDLATQFVAPGGAIVYMTCSLLSVENQAQTDSFARRSGWQSVTQRRFGLAAGGDGFFTAILRQG